MSACGRSRFAWLAEAFVAVAAAALLATVPAARARAQSLTGVVLLPDSVTTAPGVIVVATDANGATAGRALSGDRRQFTLRLPAAGSYRVTLLRIGFRPTQLPAVIVDVAVGAPRRF